MAEEKAKKQHYGHWGEEKAVSFLESGGFRIVERNWHFGRIEIDIIAEKDDILIFIEVKARKNADYGFPEESVNYSKQEKILEAAEEYIELHNVEKETRFDIISITGTEGNEKVVHFIDAISPYDE